MFKSTITCASLAIAAQAQATTWPYWGIRDNFKYAYCVVEENPATTVLVGISGLFKMKQAEGRDMSVRGEVIGFESYA